MKYFLKVSLLAAFIATTNLATSETVGYRYDGSGIFPDQQPVAFWTRERNIIWSTPMPGTANGSPIVVGERIFVTAEPDKLLCVNKADGAIMWSRSNAPEEILGESMKEADAGAMEKRKALQKEIGDGYRQYRRLGRQARKAENPAEIEKEQAELQRKLAELQAEIDRLPNYFKANTHPENGFCSQTPISDGKYVYNVFGSGITVCYDMEGNRQWGVFVEHANDGRGQGASPVLVGDKLLVHYNSLVALNVKNGQKVWEASEAEATFGTPVLFTLGDTEVVATPGGDIVRVSDGEILASGLYNYKFGSPIIHNNIIYGGDRGEVFAFQVELGESGKVISKELWKTIVETNGEKRNYGGPILYGGKLYVCADGGAFTILDAASGQIIHEDNLGLGDRVYDMVAAGEILFISAGSGKLLTMSLKGDPDRMAVNDVGRFFGSPALDESKLYLRTFTNLYCIGRSK